MNGTLAAAITCACLFVAVGIGIGVSCLLPEHYLNADTRDTVKLGMGLVATMSALLLGLLVSSAKNAYDTTRGQVIQMAAKAALLDRMLAVYGPEATDVRTQFHSLIDAQIKTLWPEEVISPIRVTGDAHAGDAFYIAVQNLSPQNEAQRSLKTQIAGSIVELAELRSLLLAHSISSISKPLLIVVIAWLMLIFLGFSILAPHNSVASVALLVSALSVAGAIFLILELDGPFTGLIRISSEPMLNVRSRLGGTWGL
jgi:hypothetical protein